MLRLIIILLILATAIVHFNFFIADPSGGVIYALNALGYLGLLALLYLPISALDNFRGPARLMLMGYAALTILAYIAFGVVTHEWTVPLGPVTKVIEVLLIGLLGWEGRGSSARTA